ncbi:hypothetical protein [Flavivirga jejuensis]|uniref:Uncharacterized protein n=1 Tax=Flavivirga jejuensis TaxID=870487 RepID=A0ABT8WRG7_9FLAO|nr:hypothetical protein [Flavivirga jejuensis]MDO5975726.1 hypothetical protein [Flavivirga jejuensis]
MKKTNILFIVCLFVSLTAKANNIEIKQNNNIKSFNIALGLKAELYYFLPIVKEKARRKRIRRH